MFLEAIARTLVYACSLAAEEYIQAEHSCQRASFFLLLLLLVCASLSLSLFLLTQLRLMAKLAAWKLGIAGNFYF